MFIHTADYRILSEATKRDTELLGDGFFNRISTRKELSERVPIVTARTIASAVRELEGLWFSFPKVAELYRLPVEEPHVVALAIARDASIKKLSLRDFVSTFTVMAYSSRISVVLGDRELLAYGESPSGMEPFLSIFRGSPTMRKQVREYGRSMLNRDVIPSR